MIVGAVVASLLGMAWVAIATRLHATMRMLPRLPKEPPADLPIPVLSIVVPARNEEAGIESCVRSLLAQEGVRHEVVVVDDASTDRTPQILGSLKKEGAGHLRVLRSNDPPAGWIGKNHACAQGAAVAEGEWILFSDADVRLAPDTARRALAFAVDRRLDLLSLAPRVESPPVLGALFLPGLALGVWTGFPLERVNDPDEPVALASGAFLLFRRKAYDAIGGHGAVRAHIVEDISLALRAKTATGRTLLADGRELVRTRMYGSLPAAWEGITKNAFAACDFSAARAFVSAALLAIASLGPAAGLVAAWIAGSESVALWALALAAELLVAAAILRETGLPLVLAPLVPIGLAIWSAGIVASALGTRAGGVEWKGRRYYAGGSGIPEGANLRR